MRLFEGLIFGMLMIFMTEAKSEDAEVFAEVGSQVVLPCKCRPPSRSSSAITWIKANKGTVWSKDRSGIQRWGASWSQRGVPRILCPHNQFQNGDCSLQINGVRESDGGLYVCRLDGGLSEQLVTLRIIKVSFSPAAPLDGDDVSVGCDVTPWPHGATFKLNSTLVPSDGFAPKSVAGAYVARGKASARLAGKWTCVVRYKGTEGRASATLSVKGIVQPSRDNTKVYASVGSAAILPCVFSAGLNPAHSVWVKLKPGSLFKAVAGPLPPSLAASKPLSRLDSDKSVVMTQVEVADKGRYRCSGVVEGKTLTRDTNLIVAKIDSSVPSKKGSVLTLTCQLTDTAEVTKYEWVHVTYDFNGTQSVGFVQNGKTLSISKVLEEGEWTCRFYGEKGVLGNVTYYTQKTSAVSGQESTSGSQNTGLVVGLSFLLLVLLLILAQMYKNHLRRKRILQYPALETIVHTISNEHEERQRTRVKE